MLRQKTFDSASSDPSFSSPGRVDQEAQGTDDELNRNLMQIMSPTGTQILQEEIHGEVSQYVGQIYLAPTS